MVGCTPKIHIKAIKPSIIKDKDIKQIYIDKINNDYINLQTNISSKMNNIYVNDIKYFDIVKESNNNVIDTSSILSGTINSTKFRVENYTKTKTDYNRCAFYKKNSKGKVYCARHYEYEIECLKYIYFVDATINITKVSNERKIINKHYNKSATTNVCGYETIRVPNEMIKYKEISNNIANSFVSLISPSYNYFTTTTIDEEDIKYTKKQKELLVKGIKLLDKNYITNANKIFKQLVISTLTKSSTALYNLGLTEELEGRLDNAYIVYKKAQEISLKNTLNDNILQAVKRVELTKSDKQATMDFLNE